jgi:ribosome-associated protein
MSPINLHEICFRFVSSTGPGGQNVNKVATTAVLTFNVAHSKSLSNKVRNRLILLAGKRIDKDGVLTIVARRFRSQDQNRRDAIKRLESLIRKATLPEKSRRPTRPTKSSIKHRLEMKKNRGKLKQNRKNDYLQEE